ncbi:MAG: DUF1223 domain-containing protein [Gammaproteobacteria bacterium]|jgi:hypothetical protein
MKPGVVFLCAIALSVASAGADPDTASKRFESGPGRVALLELYTSEGCSSCPPADRWLRELKSDPRLWKDFVPVAFHVDYWDYIGWEDRFARPAFSHRQRRYVADGRASTVYTPGLFNNGEEWRGWFRGEAPSFDPAPVGALSLTLDGDRVSVRFEPPDDEHGDLEVQIAILGMGLETEVRAGENRGRTLRHDFVLLELISRPLDKGDGGFLASAALPGLAEDPTRRALVAWVSRRGDQAPIQSVGGFL